MIYGKVIEYDNYIGRILDENGLKYIFTNDDLKSKNIKIGDYVFFEYDEYKTIEIKEYRAHFIRKINDIDIFKKNK